MAHRKLREEEGGGGAEAAGVERGDYRLSVITVQLLHQLESRLICQPAGRVGGQRLCVPQR